MSLWNPTTHYNVDDCVWLECSYFIAAAPNSEHNPITCDKPSPWIECNSNYNPSTNIECPSHSY